MNFFVRFSVENAAFDLDRVGETVYCLAEVQRMINLGYEHGKVVDTNGNVVGDFGLEEN